MATTVITGRDLAMTIDTKNYDEQATSATLSCDVTIETYDTLYSKAYKSIDSQWTFDVADADGDAIVSGVAVVVDFPLMRRAMHDPRMPPGALFAVDTANTQTDPGLADLGPERRVQLVYFTEAELPLLAA